MPWIYTSDKPAFFLPASPAAGVNGKLSRPIESERLVVRSRMPVVQRPEAAWVSFGLAGRASLDAARYGSKGAELEAVAKELGITAQTVRRSAAALSFVETEKFPVELTALPLTAVECLRRWASYDLEAAKAAARQLYDGATVAWVAEEEKKARRALGARPPAARHMSDELFDAIVSHIETRHAEFHHNPMIGRMRQRAARDSELAALPPADLYFSDARGKRLLGVATIIRPPDPPRTLLPPLVAKALVAGLGLSTLFDKSIVVCLNRATLDYCNWWLAKNRERDRLTLEYCAAEPE